jgi:hypothetical protein
MAGRVVMAPRDYVVEEVAKLKGVRGAVRQVGKRVYTRAQANRAQHYAEGEARIEMTEAEYYSHWGVTVSMIDPNVLSIEFDHYVRKADGTRVLVPGTKIMRNAIEGL